jgi:hypothetical protein
MHAQEGVRYVQYASINLIPAFSIRPRIHCQMLDGTAVSFHFHARIDPIYPDAVMSGEPSKLEAGWWYPHEPLGTTSYSVVLLSSEYDD